VHLQIQHQKIVRSAHSVFTIFYLRTNSDFCLVRHKLIGFYNRNEKSLLRDGVFTFK